jgi:hypothetical protein
MPTGVAAGEHSVSAATIFNNATGTVSVTSNAMPVGVTVGE